MDKEINLNADFWEEVTVKLPKRFYDAMLEFLNRHPYYEDFREFLLEALREHMLTLL